MPCHTQLNLSVEKIDEYQREKSRQAGRKKAFSADEAFVLRNVFQYVEAVHCSIYLHLSTSSYWLNLPRIAVYAQYNHLHFKSNCLIYL